MLGRASAAMTLDVYADLFGGDLDDLADGLDRLHRAGTACQRQPKVDPGAAATGSSFSFRQQSPMAPCRLPFSGTGRPAASRLP